MSDEYRAFLVTTVAIVLICGMAFVAIIMVTPR